MCGSTVTGARAACGARTADVAGRAGSSPPCRSTPKPEGVPSELADIVIRALDFADLHDIDLGAAIEGKLAYNVTRGHRHGGKAL